jgi:hypothetical protein
LAETCCSDFEDDLAEFRFKECLLLLMVSAECTDEEDEIVPSVCVRVSPEGRVTTFFLFSAAVESREGAL